MVVRPSLFAWLALLPLFVHAQTPCPGICPDGGPVTDALVLPDSTTTCGQLDALAKAAQFACTDAGAFASYCECANLPFECRVCPAGSQVSSTAAFFGQPCRDTEVGLLFTPQASCPQTVLDSVLQTCGPCEPRAALPPPPQECFLCPDGTNPTAFDPLTPIGMACQGVLAALPTATATECMEAQMGAFPDLCGCSGAFTNGTTTTCSLCADGSSPTSGSLVVPASGGLTCADLAGFAAFANETECLELQSGFLQSFCGCPNFVANCTLCPDGSIPELGSSQLPGSDDLTCDVYAASIADISPMECAGAQSSFIPAFCGCPNISTQTCSVCNNGTVQRPEVLFPGSDLSCEVFEFIAFSNTNETECPNFQSDFAQVYCGCPGVNATCTLCPDGSSPTMPESIIFSDMDGSTSCRTLEALVVGTDPGECSAFHNDSIVPTLCGCPVASACNGICPDGSFPGNPDALVELDDFELRSCQEYDIFLKNATASVCSQYQAAFAAYCGCASVPNACPLCEDGSPIPDPSLVIDGDSNCRATEISAAQAGGAGCVGFQATAGVYCGCNNAIASQSACRICGGSMLLPDSSRVVDVDASGNPMSCGFLEFMATNNPGICMQTQQNYNQSCCSIEKLACPLCEDGSPLPMPTLEATPGQSCAQLEDLLHGDPSVDLICSAAQGTVGSYCGCNNTIASKSACRICGDPLPNPLALAFGRPCVELEFEATNSGECLAYQANYSSVCCTPLAPGSAPALSPTPGFPSCSVCGEGFNVTLPNAVVSLPPSVESTTCGILEQGGFGGFLPPEECGTLPARIGVACGCTNLTMIAPSSPVIAPVSFAPVMAPVVPVTANAP